MVIYLCRCKVYVSGLRDEDLLRLEEVSIDHVFSSEKKAKDWINETRKARIYGNDGHCDEIVIGENWKIDEYYEVTCINDCFGHRCVYEYTWYEEEIES